MNLFQVIHWRQTLKIPPQAKLSPESADIILRLCKSEDERIGKDVDEIKNHPFFNQIDWTKELRSQQAPFEPKIIHPTDTSNFDPIDPDKLRDSTSDADDSFGNEFFDSKPFHHGFFEFTFRRFFDDEADYKISLDSENNKTGAIYVWPQSRVYPTGYQFDENRCVIKKRSSLPASHVPFVIEVVISLHASQK